MRFLVALGRIIVLPMFSLIFPSKRLGLKTIPKNTPIVIIGNHVSNCDAFLVAKYFKGKTYYLCKKEVFTNRFVSWLIKTLGGIKITRDSPEIGEIKNCLQTLKRGNKLVIFPEGTRNKIEDGNLLPFKSGAGLFAFKSKAQIIPFYINRRSQIFKKNYMQIGEPFTLDEFYGSKFSEVTDSINGVMAEKILECRDMLEIRLKKKLKD